MDSANAIDYIIYKGCVVSLLGCLGTSRQIGRVTYTAGYVLPGGVPATGQTPLPDEIAVAARSKLLTGIRTAIGWAW
jgi:hypothetical protein